MKLEITFNIKDKISTNSDKIKIISHDSDKKQIKLQVFTGKYILISDTEIKRGRSVDVIKLKNGEYKLHNLNSDCMEKFNIYYVDALPNYIKIYEKYNKYIKVKKQIYFIHKIGDTIDTSQHTTSENLRITKNLLNYKNKTYRYHVHITDSGSIKQGNEEIGIITEKSDIIDTTDTNNIVPLLQQGNRVNFIYNKLGSGSGSGSVDVANPESIFIYVQEYLEFYDNVKHFIDDHVLTIKFEEEFMDKNINIINKKKVYINLDYITSKTNNLVEFLKILNR